MPAPAKIASALALALGLVGGGAAIAQSTTATQGHTAYASLVSFTVVEADDRPVLTGSMPCDPPWHQALVNAYLQRPACDRDRYAYAFPQSATAPWESEILWVNDSTHIDEQGSVWHTAEVVYRTASGAPEGGEELVHAMASEVPPSEDSTPDDRDYALPLNEKLVEHGEEELIVGFGPQPNGLSTPST